jgi:hypothetical protein
MLIFFDEIKKILQLIDSVIEFDLSVYILNMIKNTKQRIINFDINEFQNETDRKSKGIVHFIKSIGMMNNKLCLFQLFERKGDIVVINNPNYDYDREVRCFSKIDVNDLFDCKSITEKKLYLYLKAIQYKKVFSFKTSYLKSMNLSSNIYRIESNIKKFDFIDCVTKKSYTEIEIIFKDIEVSTKKIEPKSEYDKHIHAHRFDPKPLTETNNKAVTETTEVETKGLTEFNTEVKNVLGQSYLEFEYRFESIKFYKNNDKIYVKAQAFNIQWLKDNKFDKRILHRFYLQEVTFTEVVFVETKSA